MVSVKFLIEGKDVGVQTKASLTKKLCLYDTYRQQKHLFGK